MVLSVKTKTFVNEVRYNLYEHFDSHDFYKTFLFPLMSR